MREGIKAPEIALLNEAGEKFRLSALKGRNVVVYFYPKADTPGCTKQACGFRDEMPSIERADTVVVGISPDPVARLAKFKEKYQLNFTLLSDVDHKVAEAYGVWVEKVNYGRTYMGVERTTFVVGKDGKIAKIFPKVKVTGHTEAVLAALAALPQ